MLTLAAPAVTFAQSNPFGPVTPAPIPQPSAPVGPGEDTDTNDAEGSLKTWQELALYGLGGLIIFGLGWLIVRDARKHAPVEDKRRTRDVTAFGGVEGDKPHDPHAPRRKQVARKKAKAAKKARKTTKRRS